MWVSHDLKIIRRFMATSCRMSLGPRIFLRPRDAIRLWPDRTLRSPRTSTCCPTMATACLERSRCHHISNIYKKHRPSDCRLSHSTSILLGHLTSAPLGILVWRIYVRRVFAQRNHSGHSRSAHHTQSILSLLSNHSGYKYILT